MVQGNEDVYRLFKLNTRYILGGRPFKLLSYQNAIMLMVLANQHCSRLSYILMRLMLVMTLRISMRIIALLIIQWTKTRHFQWAKGGRLDYV